MSCSRDMAQNVELNIIKVVGLTITFEEGDTIHNRNWGRNLRKKHTLVTPKPT